ncbi:MAG: hypothetical protein B0D92_08410 [Spirochaeta sp. LUC14_002_19_P3]|nr:MAG: hypothetical protein B0D92_08410 [Spirochaeta sp. LUC14_002_19_P3]
MSDLIGPAAISNDLTAAIANEYHFAGGSAFREYLRAIEVAVDTLELREKDKVMLSPLAPAAYGKVLLSRGIIPVLADVRESDACLDTELAMEKAREDIKAIFIHAPAGQVPDMKPFYELGIPVIIDIGEALGARESDSLLGHKADLIILPMETDSIATTGGGTLVLAHTQKHLKALQSITAALTPDTRLPDLNASLGIIQWQELASSLESRNTIRSTFEQSLKKGQHRTLMNPKPELVQSAPYSFPAVLGGGMNEVRRYAGKNGVETLPAFSRRIIEMLPEAAEQCPRAQSLMLSTILFPLYPTLGSKNIQLIMKVLSTLP